jgi:hypothetical protein
MLNSCFCVLCRIAGGQQLQQSFAAALQNILAGQQLTAQQQAELAAATAAAAGGPLCCAKLIFVAGCIVSTAVSVALCMATDGVCGCCAP